MYRNIAGINLFQVKEVGDMVLDITVLSGIVVACNTPPRSPLQDKRLVLPAAGSTGC